MLKWIMDRKKGLLKLVVAVALAVSAALYVLVPGDQHEAKINEVAGKVSDFADKLPDDPAVPAAE
jgi:outer membrane murein-binding lipoprotein Lpp